uniref:Uncharacterized protein n=1 Tax=Spongospora subterranea TaxID=70186 RepID=A0A0H5QH96_9EUKA|eukprot:CRZ00711.1 hypothetical protein [Spongospora subterranea]
MYRPIVSVAPSQCPSVVGDPVAPEPYSMRMTITLNNLTLDDQEPVADLQDINLRAHNMYYNLTKLFEKVSTSKNSKALGTFAIEFETKHDRLLPYELIQLDMIREHMDQEQLIGHFDLVLAQVAQATSGQVETTMELKDSSDKTIGKSDVSVEWIISECVR